MMLTIAFVMFAVLMLAWLTMPEKSSITAPVSQPERRPETDVVIAHA